MDVSSLTLIDFVKLLKSRQLQESEYRDQIEYFLSHKARQKLIPLSGQFELTPFCNFNCKMCYSHLNEKQFNKNNLLSPAQWGQIIDEAYQHGMRFAALTGGECLTYHGFKEVYLHLKSLGIKPGILTNGFLIDANLVSFFVKNPPKSIQITLYGSNDDDYEAVTGSRAFTRIHESIKMIRDAKLPLKISITPNKYMGKDYETLLQMVVDLGVPYGINSALFQPRSNTGRDVEDMEVSDYVNLRLIESKIHHQTVIPIDSCHLPIRKSEASREYGLKCGAGRSTFAIKYDGSMCPCISLDDYSVNPFEIGFAESWRLINSYVMNYPIPEECCGCSYSSRCFHCPAVHKNAEKGHCNPRVCQKTLEYIRAGLVPLPEDNKH